MIGKIVLTYESVDSTNTTAFELIRTENLQEGAVIFSAFQKHGKGQEGNFWESEARKNLMLSIVFTPTFLKPEKQFLLNKIISLGVAEFVQNLLPEEEVKIKWPNDIYVADKKIAGILINNIIQGNSFEYAIAGIGVNINQKIFLSDAPNPVSIIQLNGSIHDIEQLLSQLCKVIDIWYERLKNGFFESINEKYISKLYRFGTFHSYKIAERKIVAKITGISQYGRLLLESNESKLYDCDLKEIEFVI